MKDKIVKKDFLAILLFFIMSMATYAQSSIDCRFTPTTNCDQYCVLLEISSQSGQPLYIGSSSIRFSYNASVINFAGTSMDGLTVGSYTSINFDDDQDSLHPDCLVENGGQGGTPYSAHSFDGGTPGDFLNTWVLQVPTVFGSPYACPVVEDWTQVTQVCFEVLDPTGDPNLRFSGDQNSSVMDLTGTNFNDDTDPPIKYFNGTFEELHVPFATLCGGMIEGCIDATACNYNQFATIDDGSCVFLGCECDLTTSATVNCLGLDAYEVVLVVEGSGTYTVSDGINSTLTGQTAGTYAFGPYPNNQSYQIQVTSEVDPNCSEVQTGSNNCFACDLTTISTVNCLGPDAYEVVLVVQGSGVFVISDGMTTTTGLTAGTYAFGPYNTNEGYNILIQSEAVETCNVTISGTDNGSCAEGSPNIEGCTDPTACNYDFDATTEDGSCLFIDCEGVCGGSALEGTACSSNGIFGADCECIVEGIFGCTDSNSINYNPDATTDDGSCSYSSGCTDPTACNYDGASTVDDGSCSDADPGTGNTDICVGNTEVWNPTTCSYDIAVEQVLGCTDATYYNYDATANCDDGSCANNCEGDINLSTQAEVDAFPSIYGCDTIYGDLNIKFGEDITRLDSLYSIEVIYGNLDIEGNPNLVGITIPMELKHVEGNIQLENNPKVIYTPWFQNLESVGGDFYIGYNTQLASLFYLQNLVSIGGSLKIANNRWLQSLTGFYNLTTIGGDFVVQQNEALDDLGNYVSSSSPNPIHTIGGNLQILGNPNLRFLSGLSTIQSVGGNVLIRNNPSLFNLRGLENITSLQNLNIENNSFSSIEMYGFEWSMAHIPGNVYIAFNEGLNHLTFLSNLTSVDGNFTIRDSPFADVEPLSSLQHIGGGLLFRGTPYFHDISGLKNLEGSLAYLHIYDNDSLSECCILNCLAIESEDIIINDNLAGCNSIEDLADCGTCVEGVSCTASLTFNTQAAIDDFLYNGCETIQGDLTITGDDITNLNGLRNVKTITGDLKIWNNTILETLEGLESLETIGGTLWVRINPSLRNLSGMPEIESVHSIQVEYNKVLESIFAQNLAKIESLSGNLYIGFNQKLEVLNHQVGFNYLTHIGGNLTIRDSHFYTLNQFSQLSQVDGGLLIRGMPYLWNIQELYYIGELAYLHIYDNDALSDCCFYTCWEDKVPSGDILVGDNLPNCNSLEEVNASCGCE